MHNYELMYIIRPDVTEEVLKSIKEKVESIITSANGEISSFKDMGKRRLAYEIEKQREGIYSLYQFQSNADVVKEIERILNINDNVLRYLTINIDEKSA